jgi:hypothetical protein
MLWGLPEIFRRIAVEGTVRLSKAKLFLMCGEREGVAAVLGHRAGKALQAELQSAGIQVFEAGGEWFLTLKENE